MKYKIIYCADILSSNKQTSEEFGSMEITTIKKMSKKIIMEDNEILKKIYFTFKRKNKNDSIFNIDIIRISEIK